MYFGVAVTRFVVMQCVVQSIYTRMLITLDGIMPFVPNVICGFQRV